MGDGSADDVIYSWPIGATSSPVYSDCMLTTFIAPIKEISFQDKRPVQIMKLETGDKMLSLSTATRENHNQTYYYPAMTCNITLHMTCKMLAARRHESVEPFSSHISSSSYSLFSCLFVFLSREFSDFSKKD